MYGRMRGLSRMTLAVVLWVVLGCLPGCSAKENAITGTCGSFSELTSVSYSEWTDNEGFIHGRDALTSVSCEFSDARLTGDMQLVMHLDGISEGYKTYGLATIKSETGEVTWDGYFYGTMSSDASTYEGTYVFHGMNENAGQTATLKFAGEGFAGPTVESATIIADQ